MDVSNMHQEVTKRLENMKIKKGFSQKGPITWLNQILGFEDQL